MKIATNSLLLSYLAELVNRFDFLNHIIYNSDKYKIRELFVPPLFTNLIRRVKSIN